MTIKVDAYNSAPKYSRRFTVDKKHDLNGIVSTKQNSTTSIVTTSTLPTEDDYYCELDFCDLNPEDETLSTIIEFEWDMTAQTIWGPCTPSSLPNETTSLVECVAADVVSLLLLPMTTLMLMMLEL